MLFKSFSRHASLAKTIFAASNTSSSPAGFFLTTSQLKRQQSQLASRKNASFGSRGNKNSGTKSSSHNESSSANPKAYASLCNSTSYSTLSPLTTLDEDKRREALFSESVGSSGSCLIYNHQHVLVFSDSSLLAAKFSPTTLEDHSLAKRRCSMSILDESFTPIVSLPTIGRRRYSTSSTDKLTFIRSSDLPQNNNTTSNTNINDTNDPSIIPEPLENQLLEKLSELSQQTSSPTLSSALKTPLESKTVIESQVSKSSPQSIISTHSVVSDVTPLTPSPPPPHPSYTTLHPISSNLKAAISSDSFDSVLDTFNQFAIHNIKPSTQDLESILFYLQNTSAVSSTLKAVNALEVYTQSLASGVKPSINIYTSIISTLLSTASDLKSLVSLPIYSSISRHAKRPYFSSSSTTGVPVIPSLESLVSESSSSSSFVKLALEIFYASNSVNTQEYTPELYTTLIKACVENGQERALYPIIRAYESKYSTLGPDAYIQLVKGYGQYADINAVLECYKFYKFHSPKFDDPKAVEMYSALATAFFDANVPGAALEFLSKLLAQSNEQVKAIQTQFSIYDVSDSLKSNPESLIGPERAAKYKQAISKSISSLYPVISAVVIGFAKLGDFKSCWKWIQKVDSDPFLPAIDISTLVSVMRYATDSDVLSVSEKLFDFMASRKDSLVDEFNTARSDFLLLCARTNTTNLLMKAIKESQIRNGVWDLMTVLYVSKYLVRAGEADLAVKVFNQQSERYHSYVTAHDIPSSSFESQATETLAEFLNTLQQSSNLSVKATLSLAKSSFFSARSFFGENGGQNMLQVLWNDAEKGCSQLYSLNSSPSTPSDEIDTQGNIITEDVSTVGPAHHHPLSFTLADVISMHLVWIKASSADNSLGGLSIPYPLLDHLKDNFVFFVKSFIKQHEKEKCDFFLSSQLVSDVSSALDKLDKADVRKEWNVFCSDKVGFQESEHTKSTVDSQKHVSNNNTLPASSLPWDTTKTSSICLLATNPNTLYQAFYDLEACVANKSLIGAEAYVNIIETAASQKNVTLVQNTYKLALSGLPHPDELPQAWTAWATIHRAVVAKASVFEKQLAFAAYQHLLEMGTSPCATGYGQMIANNVVISNHHPHPVSSEFSIQEDAAEALRLFQESKNRGVHPNTFLYNVVLAKLAKARKFGTVFSVFQDMEFTQIARSSVTFGTMIHASCLAGDEKQALRLFNDMESSPFYTPKVAPFNALLQFYVHTKKDRAAALSVYNQLKKRAESGSASIQPSEHTYRLLIDAFTLITPVDINSADRVLLTAVANNSTVTTRHYAALLYARGVVCKNIPSTRQFYEALTEQRRVRPDRHIFQAILESLVACAQVQDVTAVLKEMVVYGVDLDDAYLADLLIRGWAREDLRKAVGLFEHCLQIGISTDPSVFEAVARAYAYHNDLSSVHGVFRMMKNEYGFRDDVLYKLENEIVAKFMVGNNPDILAVPELRESILSESSFRANDPHALRVLEAAKLSMIERLESPPFFQTLNSWTALDEYERGGNKDEHGGREGNGNKEENKTFLGVPGVNKKPSLVEF